MTGRCSALVGGFGRPGLRDLDFGRQLVDYLQELDWPEGVEVEDLSCAVPLFLHRLQELRPAKVVLLGAVPRGLDPPGTVRRYRVDRRPSPPEDVQRRVEESVLGLVDLDHTLAVARQWGGLPVDTVVIEVEPAETAFGLGFSEELAGCIDPLVDMVREELGDLGGGVEPDLNVVPEILLPDAPPARCARDEPSQAVADLLGYASSHTEARLQAGWAPSLVDAGPAGLPGVALAGRVRPWGVFLESGGDWFDAVPLGGGRLAIVVGDVAGRGAEVAAIMSDLRAAVRAYMVLDGSAPARLVGHLDRLADTTGLGRQARVLCLTLDLTTSEVTFANAGSCAPLMLEGEDATGRFLDAAQSAPIGEATDDDRPEATFRLAADSTLLLCTRGLVESGVVGRDVGMERFRRAASGGPRPLGDLCDHVLTACTRSLRRDDDICLLGVRLAPEATAVAGDGRDGAKRSW